MSNSLQNLSSEAMPSNPTISVQDATTESAFPLFGKLPPEVRFIIWKLAATNQARRVEITDNEFDVDTLSPATLFVNSESKAISKVVLSKLFDGQTFTGKTHEVYFCPEKDTIAFKDIRYFSFPRDEFISGPSHMTYVYPSRPEYDSVKILELEEDLGIWMYHAVHFGSLDKLIFRIGNSIDEYRDRVFLEATKYYQEKLAHGNCTKVPEIIFRFEPGLEIKPVLSPPASIPECKPYKNVNN